MRAHALAGLVALQLGAACGDEPGLEDTWVRKQFPNGRPCAEVLQLKEGDVVSTILCDLADKQVGAQITAGRYRSSGNALYVTPVRSSCPGWPTEEATWQVTFNQDVLHRTMGTVTDTFSRGALEIAASRITGCFDADLQQFDEGLVREL
jgi:hypothetical protein